MLRETWARVKTAKLASIFLNRDVLAALSNTFNLQEVYKLAPCATSISIISVFSLYIAIERGDSSPAVELPTF